MAKGITFAFEKIGNNDPVDRFAVCEMSWGKRDQMKWNREDTA
jgi:hypothetical protein